MKITDKTAPHKPVVDRDYSEFSVQELIAWAENGDEDARAELQKRIEDA